ncbi:sulfatase family protein [Sphingobacterium griseoflavum]|uniref:N-acetylgalactosamine-6-sulfatase n=1 Tax=Sphingobacterium griseoflavum TaxID=1474952 RepID=A0ABQ3I0L9_9SPHI|nr:sulfatase-like hydrolase/transferase [Sphingobacterium griseoflavum]GHE42077.1 N-acetylgalactosamine-6-sulfatase [Sphingobacterium griseoflavum]
MVASKILFLFALLSTSYVSLAQQKQPNVIIILVDDMGFGDVTTFGGDFVPTPNIDRLAKNGLLLKQYYSGAPICSPSRASLLTGMYPGRWNFSTYLDNREHNRNAEQADYLDPRAPSIARIFRSAGYTTGHFGKWHMGGGRDVTHAPGFASYGYDAYASTYESPEPDPLLTATNWIWSDKGSIKRWDRTRYFVDKALAFFRENTDKPRFVNLWPDDVHTPWVPNLGEGYTGKFPLGRASEAAFKRVLQELDTQIGRLIDGLKDMGEYENTIIVFTSDNGPLPSFRGSRTGGLRGSKLSLYEGGIRMPFLISWPGHIPAGIIDRNSEVHAIDLLPSLARMAAVKLPSDFKGDGIDRSPVFAGTPSPRQKNMFWEYGRNDTAFKYPAKPNKSPNLAIRSGAWKLLMNTDGSDVQLYHIVADENETNEQSAQQVERTKALKAALEDWWNTLPKLNN